MSEQIKLPTVKAVLVTRCGCSREMVISFPPAPQLHLALRMKNGCQPWNCDLGKPGIEERIFEREEIGYADERAGKTDGSILHVLYREI